MAQLLHALITDRATATPAALALRDGEHSLSYGALERAMRAAAQGMLRLGLAPGARVALLMERRSEAVVTLLGAAAAGLVCVPIDPRLAPRQVGAILADSGAALLVTTARRLAALATELAACPALAAVVLAGPQGDAAPALPLPLLAWNAWMDGGAVGMPEPRRGEQDPVVLCYPALGERPARAVHLSHRALVDRAVLQRALLGITARDRVGALLCLSGAPGLTQLAAAFAGGAAAVLMHPLLTRDIAPLGERERLTVLAAAPALWEQLAQLHWDRLPALRAILSCGAPLTQPTRAALRARLPGAALVADDGAVRGLLAA